MRSGVRGVHPEDLPEPVPAEEAIITQRILTIYASSKSGAEVKV